MFLVRLLVQSYKLFQVSGIKLGIQLNTLVLFHFCQDFLENVDVHAHGYIGKHLNKAPVGVPGKAGIPGLGAYSPDGLIVHAKVQDGIHHTGHGNCCTGTYGHQQGILRVTQFFSHQLLELVQVFIDLIQYTRRLGTVILIIGPAHRCRDRETRGYRDPEVCHFSEICSFSSKKLLHAGVSVGFAVTEEIDEFLHR